MRWQRGHTLKYSAIGMRETQNAGMEVKLPRYTLAIDERLSTAIFSIAEYGGLKRFCSVHSDLMSAACQWFECNPGGLAAHLVEHAVVRQRPFTFFRVGHHALTAHTGQLGDPKINHAVLKPWCADNDRPIEFLIVL